MCVCVLCVCVFFPFILDIKFVGRTSRGHTGFLIHLLSAVRALIFLARRIERGYFSTIFLIYFGFVTIGKMATLLYVGLVT